LRTSKTISVSSKTGIWKVPWQTVDKDSIHPLEQRRKYQRHSKRYFRIENEKSVPRLVQNDHMRGKSPVNFGNEGLV
jgi:hypothetical protein